MSKTLPILGIVGAVFAALAIAVLVPDSLAAFLPLLVGFAGSGVLIGQRSIHGAVAGIVILILTVVAALGLVGEVTTEEGGGADFGISVGTGQVLSIAACLSIPIAAVVLRWELCEPRWMAIAGVACAVVAFIIAAMDPDGIAQQNQVETLVAAGLALLASIAMVPLLRNDEDDEVVVHEPEPLASADASLGTRSAGAPTRSKPVVHKSKKGT